MKTEIINCFNTMTSGSYDDLSFLILKDDKNNNDFKYIANDIALSKENEIDVTTPSTDKWKDIHPDSLGKKFTRILTITFRFC